MKITYISSIYDKKKESLTNTSEEKAKSTETFSICAPSEYKY